MDVDLQRSDERPIGLRGHVDSTYELDSILSAEDTALLQSLMMVGSADRVEFMG